MQPLADGYLHRNLAPDLLERLVALDRHRLLEPVYAVLGEPVGEFDCGRDVVHSVRVYEYLDVGAYRLAHRADYLVRGRQPLPAQLTVQEAVVAAGYEAHHRVELESLVSGVHYLLGVGYGVGDVPGFGRMRVERDAVADWAAEKLVYGQTEFLAAYVPQRYVNAAYERGRRAPRADVGERAEYLLPQALEFVGVLAGQEVADLAYHRGYGAVGDWAGIGGHLAPAGYPLVGFDLDQHQLPVV